MKLRDWNEIVSSGVKIFRNNKKRTQNIKEHQYSIEDVSNLCLPCLGDVTQYAILRRCKNQYRGMNIDRKIVLDFPYSWNIFRQDTYYVFLI